jgi:solute carrier family 8 (sodium/calcium exchanger)
LGVIEIAGNEFYAGDLGPSTIVGSAAFNLFVISAVCVMAIPAGDFRTINDLGVFAITASFSVFAYVWLYIIVVAWTPEVVTIPEAVITFLFFPLLVFLAYQADLGTFSNLFQRIEAKRPKIFPHDLSKEDISKIQKDILERAGGEVPPEEMARLMQQEIAFAKSRASMRRGAIRQLTGGAPVDVVPKRLTKNLSKIMPMESSEEKTKTTATVGFKSESYETWESQTTVTMEVELRLAGPLTKAPHPVAVNYRTVDGTAKADEGDFVSIREATIVFNPGETVRTIAMQVLNDELEENDEEFFVELYNVHIKPFGEAKALEGPKTLNGGDSKTPTAFVAVLGEIRKAAIKVIDDDGAGMLRFAQETTEAPSLGQDKIHYVQVQRSGGSAGKVTCKYTTEDDTAIAVKDFDPLDGTLIFEEGQSSAFIEVNIKAAGHYESEERFRIILSEASGGVRFDDSTDGGADTCIAYVIIKATEKSKAYTDKVAALLISNYDKLQIGNENYAQQFKNAITLHTEDGEDASMSEWAMHFFTFFWKVLFACIPPTDYLDGWLCFCVSLVFIGGVTLFIGDLASLLGCVLEIPDAVTAITFVALGTSLPDTFASKSAAIGDPYADASIGNVTGSNSVNVFLGIGISWSVGAIYWEFQDDKPDPNWPMWLKKFKGDKQQVLKDYSSGSHFAVKSGDLGFSVILFCVCAVAAIAILMFRRSKGWGELGGPTPAKQITGAVFVGLWLIYVGGSTYKTFKSLEDDPCS